VKLQWRKDHRRKIYLKVKSAVEKIGILGDNPAARTKLTQALACALEEYIAYEVSPRTVAADVGLSEKLRAELTPLTQDLRDAYAGDVSRGLIPPWTAKAGQLLADTMVVEPTKTVIVPKVVPIAPSNYQHPTVEDTGDDAPTTDVPDANTLDLPAQTVPASTTTGSDTLLWNMHTQDSPASSSPILATSDTPGPAFPTDSKHSQTAPVQSTLDFKLPRDPPTVAPVLVDDSGVNISFEELRALQPLKEMSDICRGIPHTTRRQQINLLFKRMKHTNALAKKEKSF
jgi:hypothetical protein